MKNLHPPIEAFAPESRSELIQYIARDIPLFEKIRTIAVGFEICQGVIIDILALDESGRMVAVKPLLEEEDGPLVDLFRQVALLNRTPELVRNAFSVPSISTVFPARGILVSPTFSKRMTEASESLVRGGVEFYIYRPISFGGFRFLWIGKFPLSEFSGGQSTFSGSRSEILSRGEVSSLSRLAEAKLTNEEIEELKTFALEREEKTMVERE